MTINDRRGAATMTHRRNFLIGIASLIVAPAVVRADVLMPIRVWRPTFGFILHGGGMGSWVTCKKSELVGVNLASLGLPRGHDWNGRGDTWYWRPERAPAAMASGDARILYPPGRCDYSQAWSDGGG